MCCLLWVEAQRGPGDDNGEASSNSESGSDWDLAGDLGQGRQGAEAQDGELAEDMDLFDLAWPAIHEVVAEERDEAASLPRFDPESKYVSDHIGQIGRITILHENTTKEAVSVYCKIHRCSIIKKCNQAPSMEKMLEWLGSGRSCASGLAGAREHRQKWAEICGT